MTPLPAISDDRLLYRTTLTGSSGMWSKIIGRGKTLRLTDLEGGANVGLLLYNALERHERYNMPDTLKGQQVFFLTSGCCLHSDMGRLLASITADSSGWHDTVCGCSDAELVRAKYGEQSYQTARNAFYRNGRECFLIELAKWGLGERDLVPNLNLFSKVLADADGALTFDPSHARAGAAIDLRCEMDVLVVLNTCPHPFDPSPNYAAKPVMLEVFRSDAVADDDACLRAHPENARAYANNEIYHRLRF